MDHPAPRPSRTPGDSRAHGDGRALAGVPAGAGGGRAREGGADAALVAAVRAGDDGAFERLYARHAAAVGAQVRGMLHDAGRAEDVTQEVFLSALRRMRETDGPIAFGAWVREIARNACIDHFRRAQRRPELSFDAGGGLGPSDRERLADAGQAPDAAVARKQAIGDLQGAFGELSDAHHRILVLRELDGLSYAEIGERLGLGRAAVESTLFRARRRLAAEYEELSTGAKCLRVRGIVATAAQGPVSRADERRLARHLARCAGCRREAWAAGVATPPRPGRRALGALVPLPAFLRRLGAAHIPVGARVDPEVGTWVKAAAAAAAMALTGLGAGEVARHAGGGDRAVAAQGAQAPRAARAATPAGPRAGAPGAPAVRRAGRTRPVPGAAGGRAVAVGGRTPAPAGAGAGGGGAVPVAGGGALPDQGAGATADPAQPASAGRPAGGGPRPAPVPSAGGTAQPAAGGLPPVTGAVTGSVGPVVDAVTKPVQPVVDAVTKPVQPVVDAATRPVQPVVDAVTRPVQPVVDAVTRPVQPAVDAVTKPVQQAVGGVIQPVEHVVARTGQAGTPSAAAAPVAEQVAQPAQDAVGSLLGRP
jgi:RNA polymerase sigma factor (sigma-70 family)